MKKHLMLLISASLTMTVAHAQTVAWTLNAQSREVTYTYPTWPNQYYDKLFTPKHNVRADYSHSGFLFVAGIDTYGQIKIYKLNPADGTVNTSHTEINAFAAGNPGYITSLKIFRHATLANLVYVFGREYNGTDYDVVLIQYDVNLNLLNKRIINGTTDTPGFLEVEPFKGNPLISFNSGGYQLKRLNLNLSDHWTRSLTSSSDIFRFCPNLNWIVLVSGAGIQRISPDGYTTWTVPSITYASDMDIDVSGNIFVAVGTSGSSSLRKYTSGGSLVFYNAFPGPSYPSVYCKADNTGSVFYAEDYNRTLKKFGSTGTLIFNQTLPLSYGIYINALEFANSNIFVTGSCMSFSSFPVNHYTDTALLYKYTAAGSFVYRDGFTSPPAGTTSAYTGIYATGIAKSGTEITIIGKRFDTGTSYNKAFFGWYFRKYGPVAKSDNSTVESFSDNINTVTIFPNPTNDNVNIGGVTGSVNYSILDISGKIVQSGIISDNHAMLELRALSKGIYFLKLDDHHYSIPKKIIKN